MIEKLSTFVVKRRWWVVAVWLLAAILLVSFAPPISEIESNDQNSFLPDTYESIKAGKVAQQSSTGKESVTDIIVFKAKSGQVLTASDFEAVTDAVRDLNDQHIPGIKAVVTSDQQIAPTKKAQLATIVYSSNSATGASEDKQSMAAVSSVRDSLTKQLANSPVTGGVTGQVAISADTQDSAERALKIVSIGTILLVLLLPAFIFRSFLAGLLPLVSIGVVYAMSNALISIAGHIFGFTLNQQLSVMFTVVLFGIGTDYVLFLLFRYRERLRNGDHTRGAVSFALSRAGEAIFSAALVVLTSFVALFFADFGIFSSFAPGLVICVLMMLLASITLVPALVAIIGEKLFWPSKAWMTKADQPTISKKVGGLISRRPGFATVIVVVVLGAFAAFSLNYRADFSSFSRPPAGTASASAYDDLTSAFPAGVLNPTVVYVTSTKTVTMAQLQPMLTKLTKADGVASVQPVINPDGKGARISLILNSDPYSSKAIGEVAGPIRDAAHSINSDTTQVYVGGATAAFADVEAVTNRDLRVIFPIAAAFIFVILIVLLRSLLAPILLLLCVSLGYVATLGATTLIFQTIGGDSGLISFIPLFLYIFVVAIGTDYNILTITRLREEIREGNNPRLAADLTVEHSSATVVSAGTILAATFGSLMLGGISFLSQMGASIAIGVALSAFIIAPFLIPSISALLGYKIWWPGHRPDRKDS